MFVVDAIRFVSATDADVDFHLPGMGTPSAPTILHGSAVVQGGHWRVSKKTACVLAALVGNTCVS